MSKGQLKVGVVFTVVLALFGFGFLLGRVLGYGERGVSTYQVTPDQGHPHELVAVFVLSSNCFASRDEEMPRLVEEVKQSLKEASTLNAHEFRAVAVGVDPTPEASWSLIQTMGRFDEVILGGGWLNHGMLSYVWEGHAGPPDVPQIVLVRRGLRRMSDGLYGVTDAEVLGRFVGFGEIRRWVYAGAPVRRALGTDSGHAATR
jgi:hypothetical protein